MNSPKNSPMRLPMLLSLLLLLVWSPFSALALAGAAGAEAAGSGEADREDAAEMRLQEAWARAALRTPVITAELEAQEAEAAWARAQADPLALRPERVQAEGRAVLALARLEQARYAAQSEIGAAWTEVLEAEARVALARQALALQEQGLRIAEIRFERGGATELDVREAQSAALDAQSNLQAAEEAARLAARNLAGMLRLGAVRPRPVDEAFLPPLPALSEVLAATQRHPDLIELEGLVTLAELNVRLLDPSFAPRFQIEDAARSLERAREGRSEALRAFELRARGLLLQAETALETWRIREESVATARERLSLEASRLEAGLIAEVDFRRSELQFAQAELAALETRHAYLEALLGLQAGSMLPLWEDHAGD